jgi:hypothetical protein
VPESGPQLRFEGTRRPARVGPAREIAKLQQLEREYAPFERGARSLKKKPSGSVPLERRRVHVLQGRRTAFSVRSLCRRYGVTAAGFYAWRRRGRSAHAEQGPPRGHDFGHALPQTHANGRNSTQMHPHSKARHAKAMQRDATKRKSSDRTAKPLFAGSIPARASR